MYKITISYKDKVTKRKFYETAEEFEKWYSRHQKHYGKCYTIRGFELTGIFPDNWEEI